MDIVLYTRRGCGLCEAAEDMLAVLAPDAAWVDVAGDAALESAYGTRVPVLVVAGRIVAEGRFDEAAVAAALVTGRG